MEGIEVEENMKIEEIVIPKVKWRQESDHRQRVSLTWEDLWITVSNRKGVKKSILEAVTGYACPGQLLAIMGPSGCGKSTLLDALAGRLDSNAKQSGHILVNGHKQTLAYGTSAYVTQNDTLMSTLTVRESVDYASQLQLPSTMSKSEKRKRGGECIKEMGLQDAIDTRIGGWGVKGLSGGQKRRLSICIETLTNPSLVFLDEPTSGLDSAASFHVMNRIAETVKTDGRTMIASIHQPSAEVFSLFDNLCLLCAGKTVYFGPASQANQFFASNGMPCPTLQNPSDHFLRMINKDFDEDDKDVELGQEKQSTEVVVNILLKSYKSSQNYQQLQGTISTIWNVLKREKLCWIRKHANFSTQCQVLTRRSFVNMRRDLGYYWLRLAVYLVLAFGIGTIFFHVGFNHDSIQARGSMLMFVATYLTFMTIGGFPSFVEEMKVFKLERLNGHYGATAFVIGNLFSSMPYLILISTIPGAITYYLTGLQRGYQHFVYFTLILLTCMLIVEGLMMIVASLVPNFLMGIIVGAGIQGLMALGGGFFRLPNDIPNFIWKYPMYYISFHKYAYQGLFKNEFEGLKFPGNLQGHDSSHQMIYGTRILKDTYQVENSYSKWMNLIILIGMVFFYRLLFLVIIKTSEIMKPMLKASVIRQPKPK